MTFAACSKLNRDTGLVSSVRGQTILNGWSRLRTSYLDACFPLEIRKNTVTILGGWGVEGRLSVQCIQNSSF